MTCDKWWLRYAFNKRQILPKIIENWWKKSLGQVLLLSSNASLVSLVSVISPILVFWLKFWSSLQPGFHTFLSNLLQPFINLSNIQAFFFTFKLNPSSFTVNIVLLVVSVMEYPSKFKARSLVVSFPFQAISWHIWRHQAKCIQFLQSFFIFLLFQTTNFILLHLNSSSKFLSWNLVFQKLHNVPTDNPWKH